MRRIIRTTSTFLAVLFYFQGASGETSSKKSFFRKIKPGDTIYSLLKKNRFEDQQLRCALSEETLPKNFTLVPGKKYRVSQAKNGQYVELKFFDEFEPRSYVFWRQGREKSGCKEVSEKFKVEHVSVKGQIKGSIVGSIQSVLPDQQVAYRFIDAYVLKYNLPRVLKRGAHFSFVVEKLFDGEHFIRYGEITRTELDINGKKEVRQFLANKTGGTFVDLKDKQDKRLLYAPVDYVRISSTFQPRRFHPIKKRRQAHLGIDFELPEGRPVYAAADGKLLRFGRTRGAGNYVVIAHKNGLQSFYNHMQSLTKGLKKGQRLRSGQAIGRVGCTGYCTKPHLHFAVKKKGRFVDPAKHLKSYAYSQRSLVNKFLSNSR